MSARPSKTSIAAYERQLRAAEREADIERIAALEKALVSVHQASFPQAERVELPPPDPVDEGSLRTALESKAGIPTLIKQLGGSESPPVASPPEAVDRYELMREFRKRHRHGISFWRIRDHIEAAREADREAENEAELEESRRAATQADEQAGLDALWAELIQTRQVVDKQVPLEVKAEQDRRATAHAAEQRELDADWEKLQANDPELTLAALNRAFADNEAPAKAIDCKGNRTTVVMQFPEPSAIVPDRKPDRTPTGKRTLKKRTKTEINSLYLEALGSNAMATVKEAFAMAPGTQSVQLLVTRRETDSKNAGQIVAIYAGEFDRASHEGASGSREPARALVLAHRSTLNLKGKTAQVAPLDLKDRPDLSNLLEEAGGAGSGDG
jgi:hypothetical protein